MASDRIDRTDPFGRLPEIDTDRAVLVRIPVGPHELELVADALFRSGATGLEERDTAHGIELVVGFGNRSAAREALDALGDRAADAVVEIPDDSWFDGWRAYARSQRIGRLVVQPTWLEPDPAVLGPGPEGVSDLVISLDPGRAFGSGAHPTTRGVLAELERLVRPGVSTVVDVGSGSGVLSVGAALLGAARVVALDIDAEARRATAENAARNGVIVEVAEEVGTVAGLGSAADVVVAANIGAAALIGLAPMLDRFPLLVLAGFFVSAVDTVVDAYPTHVFDRQSDDDGWAILTLRHAEPERPG